SPHIYISCIKQFWNTASVKHSGDVTRLQALVDKKKIVISEVVIREILQLDDAEGVVCLLNEEIFAGLAQMGYEKPTSMAFAVICLSKGQKFNFSKYIFDSLVRNVDSSSKFYMYPRFIQLIIQYQVGDLSTHTTRFISPALTQKVFANIRRVGKGFSGVETPLFEGMLADRQPAEEELVAEQVQVDAAIAAANVENVAEDVSPDAIPSPPSHDIPSPSQEPSSPPQQPHITPPAPTQGEALPANFQQVLDTCSALIRHVEHLECDNVAQKLEIVKLKARVKKLEQSNKVKSSKFKCLRKVRASRKVESFDDIEDVFNQGRMIDDMDKDERIKLVKDAEVLSMQEDDLEVQEVVETVTTAKLITNVVTAATSQVSAASATIPAVKPSIPAAAPTVVATYTRRKGVIIKDLKEEVSLKTPVETPGLKDKGKGILVESPKPMKKKDQIELDAEYARKLHEEINKDDAEFNKDIDWDAAMDHLVIVNDEDDDVFTEATPLGRKVPVVDYEIVMINNKPRYKIIRADDTHQLYISFITLLKNFDREDLKDLWRIVKERFSTSKPSNFSDDYLLSTLKTMFEKTDGQDAIWRNQNSVYGQALVKSWKLLTSCGVHIISLTTTNLILLVERRYPL
nr:hypothetical protein [Tanacetum cinerariifolium]